MSCQSGPKIEKITTKNHSHPELGGQIEKFQTKSYFILNVPSEKKYNTMKFEHRDPERSIRYRTHLHVLMYYTLDMFYTIFLLKYLLSVHNIDSMYNNVIYPHVFLV